MKFTTYHGRVRAARILAVEVRKRVVDLTDAVVVSVPRGGVVVGVALAESLGLQHDFIVTRKLGESKRPEWSIGAITEEGSPVWDKKMKLREEPQYLKKVVSSQTTEARRRNREFRRGLKPRNVRKRPVILADDGVARGWTLVAAIKTLRSEGATRIIVAVPVASGDGVRLLMRHADTVISGYVPNNFKAVGFYYQRFAQVSDATIKKLLKRASLFARVNTKTTRGGVVKRHSGRDS